MNHSEVRDDQLVEGMRLVSFRWKMREEEDVKKWFKSLHFLLVPLNPFVVIMRLEKAQARQAGGTFKDKRYRG